MAKIEQISSDEQELPDDGSHVYFDGISQAEKVKIIRDSGYITKCSVNLQAFSRKFQRRTVITYFKQLYIQLYAH